VNAHAISNPLLLLAPPSFPLQSPRLFPRFPLAAPLCCNLIPHLLLDALAWHWFPRVPATVVRDIDPLRATGLLGRPVNAHSRRTVGAPQFWQRAPRTGVLQ
jgi:hypothetical protein